jgi:REP element-mobilizing transposase RayT/AraC-like DNA-binding protein
MARPLRICIPGGLYHIIARGNARGAIVWDNEDRACFFRILAKVIDRFSWLCHAYCLMDNHYHLVLETPQPNLPDGMRQLNGMYAQAFNERHDRVGHVFQSRYRSILVEKETHFVELCRYVVLNPVRAGSCSAPEDWVWSSYAPTAGLALPPSFLTTEGILSEFGTTRAQACRNYGLFICDGIDEPFPYHVKGERLGGEAFLRSNFGIDEPLREIPRAHIVPLQAPLEEIFGAGAETPVAVAYRRHGYTLRQIADHLGCSYSTISRRLRREEELTECKT